MRVTQWTDLKGTGTVRGGLRSACAKGGERKFEGGCWLPRFLRSLLDSVKPASHLHFQAEASHLRAAVPCKTGSRN